ncbi:MAG TPA: hypothetical protein VLV49_17785 [Terriglobales bacterium]|nr:hypothetical protein [Terriglobales bacterium]
MQYAKDSFYMALRERLAALNPQRTVTLNGAVRPAVIAAENEMVIPVVPLPDAFYLEWGGAQVAARQSGSRELMEMECVISYHTFGTVESGVDRGRTLGELDTELLSICQPQHTAKQDFTQSPSADLGSNIFWAAPVMGKVTGSQGPKAEGLPRGNETVRLERSAMVRVFFFPEVNFL